MGLQYYDFTLAPNGVREIPCEGTYFRYYSGSAGGADESILIKSDTQGVVTILRPGQSIKMPINVKTWRMANNKGAGTITGIVVVGDGEIQDSNVAGTVSVINGEIARVKANQSFMAVELNPAVAGQYGMVQLWNPVASGKRLILNKISVFSQVAAMGYGLFKYNTALTLQGNAASKLSSGALSSGEMRTGSNVALVGNQYANFGLIGATESKDFPFSEPFVIEPGWSIYLCPAAPNTSAYTTYQWNEEVI